MRSAAAVFSFALFATSSVVAVDKTPRPRPAGWATPVIDTSIGNCFRVSDELYRCEQPRAEDLGDMKTLGIHTVFNLREYHTDPGAFQRAGFMLVVKRLDADDVTVDQLVDALRLYRDSRKPVLVHCWHGSDRTGIFVAGYRIAFQGWTREAALDEFRHGGFGFHEKWFPNLVKLIEGIDEPTFRLRVTEIK